MFKISFTLSYFVHFAPDPLAGPQFTERGWEVKRPDCLKRGFRALADRAHGNNAFPTARKTRALPARWPRLRKRRVFADPFAGPPFTEPNFPG